MVSAIGCLCFVCEKFVQLLPQLLILAKMLAFDLISIYNIFGKM